MHKTGGVAKAIESIAVLVWVGEVNAHFIEDIPCPFIVCVKLSWVVKAPFFDNSAVVGAYRSRIVIGGHNVGATAQ